MQCAEARWKAGPRRITPVARQQTTVYSHRSGGCVENSSVNWKEHGLSVTNGSGMGKGSAGRTKWAKVSLGEHDFPKAKPTTSEGTLTTINFDLGPMGYNITLTYTTECKPVRKSPVGKCPGRTDMAYRHGGKCLEWCRDWYGTPSCRTPQPTRSLLRLVFVYIRGGCWGYHAEDRLPGPAGRGVLRPDGQRRRHRVPVRSAPRVSELKRLQQSRHGGARDERSLTAERV